MHDAKIKQVLITGAGPHLGQIAQMADHKCINRVVCQSDPGIPSDWAAAHGIGTVTSDEKLNADAIVIGGRTAEDGSFSFTTDDESWFISSSQHRIRHPIVLADLVPLDYSAHIVACGYPGSGNGIVQAIIENIIAASPWLAADRTTSLISAYAADYWHRLDVLLTEFATTIGSAAPTRWATYLETTASAVWDHGNDWTGLFGLPIRNYLCERVHKTHEPFGRKLSTMVGGGAKCVLCVRNPLDTIVSVANKVALRGADLLGTEWLLRMVGRGLVQYYQSFRAAFNERRMTVVAYEDCQARFEQVAQTLAQLCDVELNSRRVADLKRSLLNKPVGAEFHLWRPEQSNKWLRFLSDRHLQVLKEEGINEVLDLFGYPIDLKKTGSSQTEVLPILAPHSQFSAFLLHCIDRPQEHLDDLCRLGLLRKDMPTEGVFLLSNSSAAIEQFDRYLRQSDLQNLINSGRSEL